ncbi:GIY-YIG nuclease family protein [Neobacillus cucumis]|uniref:GIY-YIG nuclease family protein n=1 Tax=Neobacillus cucumis TaxID=1740721 RepID=UPI0028531C88|nr:GIY-YIG nuclease family protein [Neobacillus cucumis]MDR4950274.1 GIY-YIG nuclease family protein [Neobacillus cucumis]MED4228313.1 GIY-YIG nuclease family protein [Neobacillus cucumis]
MESSGHYFYVLTCRDGSLYGGYTNDLKRRIEQHNEGKGAKYTRGRGPVKLTYYQAYDSKSEALKAEYWFKQLTRKKKLEYLMRAGELDVAAEKL